MRVMFGALSLLVVVAIIGILAKKQLGAGVAPASVQPPPEAGTMAAPSGTPKQQVQQFKQAAEAALQQPRPMPDEPK